MTFGIVLLLWITFCALVIKRDPVSKTLKEAIGVWALGAGIISSLLAVMFLTFGLPPSMSDLIAITIGVVVGYIIVAQDWHQRTREKNRIRGDSTI